MAAAVSLAHPPDSLMAAGMRTGPTHAMPAWVASPRSALTRDGAVIARFLEPARLERLQTEALTTHRNAVETHVQAPRDEHAGHPDRWLESAPGGPELTAFYYSAEVLGLLRQLTGVAWQTSGPQGTYSYYRRAGHHLGLHRDIDICELAAITCLVDEAPADRSVGGTLYLYPSRRRESLAVIRMTPTLGAVGVRLAPGETLLLLGGLVPHQLMPLGAGHVRIIAPLCYRVLSK
jgi:hypothetical protein